jgi:hypothetical protein
MAAVTEIGTSLGISITDSKNIERAVKESLSAALVGSLRDLKSLYISADESCWRDAGVAVQQGESVTLLLSGTRWVSYQYNISWRPELALWSRIAPGGTIFRGAATQTFVADRDGALEFKIYPGVRWLDEQGLFDGGSEEINADSGGGVYVTLLHWKPGVDVLDLLKTFASKNQESTWAAEEIARLQTRPRSLPKGWYFNYELGPSDIWSEKVNGEGGDAPVKVIEANLDDNVSIIKTDVNVAFEDSSVLKWVWKMDHIPSPTSETVAPTHDYLSIAIEFDNGRDLTFMWSHDLPIDYSFHCPLTGWDFRETHVVARSGDSDLGRWLYEEKAIAEHYRTAIGGEIPKRITKVWLIAVGIFQHVKGNASFGNIELCSDTQKLKVY